MTDSKRQAQGHPRHVKFLIFLTKITKHFTSYPEHVIV